MRIRTSLVVLLFCCSPIAACSGGSTAKQSGGSGGADGVLSVPEGPPGSVGSPCKPGAECDPDLQCNQYDYCQPSTTSLPPEIVQAVPPPDSVHVPAASPIFLFTTGSFSNVEFAIDAHTQSGKSDLSSSVAISKLSSSTQKDIFVLAPKQPFPLGASVVVTLSGEIKGNLTFNIDNETAPSANGHLGIEAVGGSGCAYDPLPEGWKGFGDTASLGATGSLIPSEGSKLLALSSGAALCGQAIGDTTSVVVSGAIDVGSAANVSFDYNFQSSEFDDYCNSEFDDTFLAVLSGPKGAVAKVVDSVNLVCNGGKQKLATFPGQPDGGDADYKETGKLAYKLPTAGVGSPAHLTFVVTDVGDSILSTVVGIDNVVVGP